VFSSYFTSANFVAIPARITRTPATTTSKSECDKKLAASETKRGSNHATYPQHPATAWRCSRAAMLPLRRPPRIGS
jgi:hypothetical protein